MNSLSSTPVQSPIRAAQYVRMSTEHQQYSPENQNEVVQRYAASRGMEIVRTYSDHGRSGLNLSGREALKRLLEDVKDKRANFTVVLVYDVSRWGRFQDADESAYYEYMLKAAGIMVHYCAEQFENDGSLSSAILKTLKRTMAGEYSRELSVKVFAGQCRLIELGFRQGGPAGYGLRRQLLDRDGNEKGLLGQGDRKSLQTDRVILVPGPANEVDVVREIYSRFTRQNENEIQIAAALNIRGLLSDLGRPWTRGTVHQLLTNPKYIGVNAYNRRSFKLKKKRVVNPPDMWILRENAFTPIVSAEQFARARSIIDARHLHLSDEELLARLKRLLQRVGKLSGIMIDETEDMPSSSTYSTRFGGLYRAYQLIGWNCDRDSRYIEANRWLRSEYPKLVAGIVDELRSAGAEVYEDPMSDLLTINGEFTASLVLAKSHTTAAQAQRWHIRFDTGHLADITIAARLTPDNRSILDYYLFPNVDIVWRELRLAPENGVALDLYRFDNLQFFFSLAKRALLQEVA